MEQWLKDKSYFKKKIIFIILTRQLFPLFSSTKDSLIIDLSYSADPQCVYLVIASLIRSKTFSHFNLFSSLTPVTQAPRRFVRHKAASTSMLSTLIGCGAVWSVGRGWRSSCTHWRRTTPRHQGKRVVYWASLTGHPNILTAIHQNLSWWQFQAWDLFVVCWRSNSPAAFLENLGSLQKHIFQPAAIHHKPPPPAPEIRTYDPVTGKLIRRGPQVSRPPPFIQTSGSLLLSDQREQSCLR